MRAFLVVLDGIGVGPQADAEHADAGRNTLLHAAEAGGGLWLPHLERLGLGRILALPGVRGRIAAEGAFGKLATRSRSTDCLVGHRELAGVVTTAELPVHAAGLPSSLLDCLSERVGRGFIGGNVEGSPEESLARLGEEHQRTGRLIVIPTRVSALQIAAHRDIVPVPELEEACRGVLTMPDGQLAVGRVIARPFAGEPGAYRFVTVRRTFAREPESPTLLDRLTERGHPVLTVGGVDELFAGRGVTDVLRTDGTDEAFDALADVARVARRGLVLANLTGEDPCEAGAASPRALARWLERVDARLPQVLARLRGDDLLLLTADHGGDPGTPGRPLAREYVPLLVAGPGVRAEVHLGTRDTLADAGATLAEYFGVGRLDAGRSFLREVRA